MGKEENNVRTGRFSCIAKGQKVKTNKGYKNIEDIHIGDEVYCYNSINEIALSHVTNTFNNGIKACIKIKFINIHNNKTSSLICTPEHLVFTKNSWVEAQYLKNTDLIYGEDGYYTLESITTYNKENVYDLEVENYHNFLVSNICVHNCTNPNLQQIPSHEKVMRLMFQASEELRDIQLDNNIFELKDCEEVETTAGWKLAKDLKINDILITDNENICIKNIINKDIHTFIIEV